MLNTVKMEYVTLIWLFGLCTTDVQATTHWMVTETGLIQPRVDSPFEMARPYDLVAFLNQDTRWDNIIHLYRELSSHQSEIDQLWSELKEDTNIKLWMSRDTNCKHTSGLSLLDWYVNGMEEGMSKQIAYEDYHVDAPSYGEDVNVPDCKKISSLTFSMFAFEHLEALVKRYNLSVTPEGSLPELIAPLMNVDQFGHWLHSVLHKNTSSWLHYNMASLYWRVKGNAPKAIECSRRALHYASREYRDIALVNMGTILHRAKRPDDSVVVLEAAVDHDPQCIEAHFVLGHALAILGHFNSSVKHYEETLKLNPQYKQAALNRYGVLCIDDLRRKLKVVHRKLTKLKNALGEYAAMETAWLKSQAAFLRTMKHSEDFDYNNVEKIVKKMAKMTGQTINHLKKNGDRNSLIKYFLNGPLYKDQWFEETGLLVVESALSIQNLMNQIAKQAENPTSTFISQPDLTKIPEGKIKKEFGPMPSMPHLPEIAKPTSDGTKAESETQSQSSNKADSPGDEYEMGMPLYPPTMKVSRLVEDFDRDPRWPSERVCEGAPPPAPADIELVHPVFLPFENKGLRLKGILTDRIGVSVHSEHELPWHPPACPAGKEFTALQKKAQKQQPVPEVAQTDALRQKLLEYVGDGYPDQIAHMQDAEIGQRIHAAMHKDIAPKWMVYTLASLYWRVRNNNVAALGCLLAATKNVRLKHRDVVLTSLASVYLEMGLFDEAMQAAEEAYKLSLYEPATNFLISQLHMVRKQRTPQMFHLKQTLRVESGFMRGRARRLLTAWGCLLKQQDALHNIAALSEGDVCTEVSPGVSMLCDKNNNNCHVASVQCYTHNEKESTSTFVRLMHIKNDPSAQPPNFDPSTFDPFAPDAGLDPLDVEGHERHLHKMIKFIDSLEGCGPDGCGNIKADEANLRESDCRYQFLQLGYWLHIISFRQLITDHDLSLPPDVPPSTPRLPSCPPPPHPSHPTAWVVSRLSRVRSARWEPDASLTHQLAELWPGREFAHIGTLLANYVDTSGSWPALAAAGWWCGAGGHGACALRCLSAAYTRATQHHRSYALRAIVALLHMQGLTADAKDIAHLAFYLSPRSKTEAFLVAVSYSYKEDYQPAIWMYRYALNLDSKYLPAKACLHATMCMMLYGAEKTKPKDIKKTDNIHEEM